MTARLDIDGLLCDLDGVLHVDDTAVPGAAEARAAAGLPAPIVDLHPDRPDQRGVRLPTGAMACLPEEPTFEAIEAQGADWVHVDVMDGHFVPNLTIGPLVMEAVRQTCELPVDVHLMIDHPERYIGDFAAAGADWITVHQEACPHLHRTIQQIKASGARAGVALNPHTPVSMLEDLIEDLEQALEGP